jgi:hypothetical protein
VVELAATTAALTPSIFRKEPFGPLSHRIRFGSADPVGTVTLLIYFVFTYPA